MVLFKRILRILGYTLIILLAFAVGAVAVLTQTERGSDNLAGIISDLASSPGQTVKIGGIAGIWSGRAYRRSCRARRRRGGMAGGSQGIAVDWSPLALLSSTLRADRIYAKRIELARLPKSEKQGSAQSGGISLPLSLRLAQIDLPDIALGPELAGGVAAVAAKGSVRAEASPLQVESELSVTRTDGRARQCRCVGSFRTGRQPHRPRHPSLRAVRRHSGQSAQAAGRTGSRRAGFRQRTRRKLARQRNLRGRRRRHHAP